MAHTLNVFIDNKPGRLMAVTALLKEVNVNIRTIAIQDRKEFGMMKLVVDNPDAAYLHLSKQGFACAKKEILAVEFEDRVGGLNDLLQVFTKHDINIKDSYAFVLEWAKRAVYCVEVDKLNEAEEIIINSGYKILQDNDLYGI